MAQDPLHVLWVEPHFPGRLGALADLLVRRRGYRCHFYCHSTDPRDHWPPSVGQGLEVQVFGVGGVAREPAVSWSRTLERSLCYAYGCWEVLEARRPKPIDLVVGRSAGLGSKLFVPVYVPGAPLVSLVDYYWHPRQYDLADEMEADTPAAYRHWRRSANAIELLDLEACTLGWTPTNWQRDLFPPEYRDELWVQHDGVDTIRLRGSSLHERRAGRRLIAGRVVLDGYRVVSFVARSLDRLRGFDRFWQTANALLRARSNVVCLIVGDRVVHRGLDVQFNNRDYLAHLEEQEPAFDVDRLWFVPRGPRGVVTDVLSASDVHFALDRPYPLARSMLEAMAAGCVVIASDTAPHREVISQGQNGLLVDATDLPSLVRHSQVILDDPVAYR